MKATLNKNTTSAIYPPLPKMSELVAEKVELMDYITSVKMLSGFDYTFKGKKYHFSTNTSDQANFTKQICDCNLSLQLGAMSAEERAAKYPDGLPTALPEDMVIGWRGHLEDGTAETLIMNQNEFLDLAKAFGAATRNALTEGWTIKQRMAACADKIELDAYCEGIHLDDQFREARELADEKKFVIV